MPAPLFWNPPAGLPSGMADWKPQTPEVLYSHTTLVADPGLLRVDRIGFHPPLLVSKFHGTRLPHVPPPVQSEGTAHPSPLRVPPKQTPMMPRSRVPF